MKKFIMLFTVLMVSLSFVVTAADYTDVKEMMVTYQEMMQKCIKASDAVKDAAGTAKLFNDLAKDMESMLPLTIKLAEKYKNLDEIMKTNPPEELKPEITKIEQLSQQMMGAMMKLGPYMQDPEVQKAQQALGEIGKKFQAAVKPATAEKKKTEEKK